MSGRSFTAALVGSGCAVAMGATLAATSSALAQTPSSFDEPATLSRLGRYVERYYSRAQSLVAEESVTLQPLLRDLSFDGFPRRLVYELRVEWTPGIDGGASAATVVRELVSVGGRPPKPGDEAECVDPRAVSPEPLTVLLPGRREKFAFTRAGAGRVARRSAIMLDYAPLRDEPPQTIWRDDCVSIDLPGQTRGRVWMDPDTAEILRLDERIVRSVEIPIPPKLRRSGRDAVMTIERADTSIYYRPVTFAEPDETLLLPSRIESLTIVRNSGSPRMRMTQTFSKYRRFLTDSRLVGDR